MRLFVAAMVAAFGIAGYAAAALLWDRRHQLRLAAGPIVGWVVGLLVLGTLLVAGSCVGLIGF